MASTSSAIASATTDAAAALSAPPTAAHPFDRELYSPLIEKWRRENGNVTITLNAGGKGLQPRQRLLFKHLSKAGGTLAIAVLRLVLPQDRLTIRVEGQPVSGNDQRHHFVLGLVREPCSSYVSLWAFGSSGKGQFMEGMRRLVGKANASQYYGRTPPFNSSSDLRRFRSWVRLPAVRGVVTARYLTHYSASPRVDCWVFTDALKSTLERCLHAYESQAGRFVVNWTMFDSEWVEATRSSAHSSPHGECEQFFFNEEDLSSEVTHDGFDRNLYRAFRRWPRCCATAVGLSGTAPSAPVSDPSSTLPVSSASPPLPATSPAQARMTTFGGTPTLHFIHIPKTAGETVQQLLPAQPPGNSRMHPTARFRYIEHLIFGRNVSAGRAGRQHNLGSCGSSVVSSDWYHIPPRYWVSWPDAWRRSNFCIVRDPLARALSTYKHHTARVPRLRPAINSTAVANAWVGHFVEQGTAISTCHALPQSHYVWDSDGQRTCQYVLCYESLPDGFDALMRQLNVTVPLLASVTPIAHHAPTNLSAMDLSQEVHEAVLRRYAEDACFLGYAPCASHELAQARASLEGRRVSCGGF